MLDLKRKPYQLLLITAVVLFSAIFISPISNMDFHGITMFSVPLSVMVWVIPLFHIALWLFYLLTNRFLYSMTMTRIHVFITVSTAILIVIVLYSGIKPSLPANDSHELIGNAMQILSLIFVLGQLTYLTNILLGLFANRK